MEPTHVVGSGEFAEEPERRLYEHEEAAFRAGVKLAAEAEIPTDDMPSAEALETLLTRIRLGRYDPLSTFSVMLRIDDSMLEALQRGGDENGPDDFVVVQCVSRYCIDGHTLVTRITTSRLSIAPTVSAFLDSIDENVVPVLLAKEAVYRSIYGREVDGKLADATDPTQLERLAYESQRDIDFTIQQVSASFRMLGLEEGTRGYVQLWSSIICHGSY